MLLCSVTSPSISQSAREMTSADMYLGIRKLNVLGSVLYVAAHPDDENTRLISYLSRERLFRTGYLSITRGDGGQNLIGEEQGIDLGLIRTHELLAARLIDGGEQFFTRAYDFGFSKSPGETFTIWDKEKILSDVVWVIRKFRPDVIINRFPASGEGGHGHHTASAILANEAFIAAADPSRFPEQLKYHDVWQAKRELWNSFNFGGTNTTRDDQFKMDVGGYNPLLGKSYGEIAAESRSQHKSQGFGVPAGRGEALEYFTATKGDQPINDIMDGVDLGWKRINSAAFVENIVDSLAKNFDFLHPEKSVKGLVRLYRAIDALAPGYWRNKKLDETRDLIRQCSGLFLDVTTAEQFAVQTDSIRLVFTLNNRMGNDARLKKISVDQFDSSFSKQLEKNRNLSFAKVIAVPASKPVTQPYWLAQPREEGYYNVKDQSFIGQPNIDPSYVAKLEMEIEGLPLVFSRPVMYRFTDPVRGEIYWPLVVVPPVIISPTEDMKVVVNETEKIDGLIGLKSLKKEFSGKMVALNSVGNTEVKGFSFDNPEPRFTSKNQSIEVAYSSKKEKQLADVVFGLAGPDGNIITLNKYEIKYDHIPALNYFKDAKLQVRSIDVKTYNKKIGYIVGAGDKVPEALEQMGYEVTLLTDKELSKNNLEKYDAILTGVRAYNTNEWMNRHYEKLKKYVHEGGNLIIQYNTSNQIGPVRAKMGPYDFNISRTRVTNENAEVNILAPAHPVLNFPNIISADDFKGWIQERSIYHAAAWDSTRFETIFSMNDPGDKPDKGSLIIAKHGKGFFTYTGIVFFRQLPAGVPGAYRLLANLIALNRKKGF